MKNRIKVLRAEKDWSQEALAKKIGVSRQAINALERGKHSPSLQLGFDIAHAFEVDITEVFLPDITQQD